MDKQQTQGALDAYERIKGKRDPWEAVWKDIDEMVCPQTQGDINKIKTLDSTAIWARDQLAAGMQSLLINPALPWFNVNLVMTDKAENGEREDSTMSLKVTGWTQSVQSILLDVLSHPENNFYNQVHEFFLNLTAYGTGVFYVEECLENKRIFFKNIPLKECFFEENAQGMVTTLFRQFELTFNQALTKWPDDPVFKTEAQKNPGDKVKILHAVLVDGNKSQTAQQAYQSLYIDLDKERLLHEGQYQRFPFQVARWMVRDNDPYGVPPACHVMPDIRLINKLRRIHVQLMDKNLDPPLLVPERGFFTPLKNTPGAVNFYRNGIVDAIRPLSGLENMMPSEVEAAQCREAILKAFYVDVFRMPAMTKEMTATEVQTMTEDRMRLMGAIVGRVESEFLSPVIQSTYALLAQYGQIPPLEFGGNLHLPKLEIEYISPLSKAQKAASYQGVESVLGFLQRSGIANVYPEIYDNLDWDEALRLFFNLKSVPVSILRSAEDTARIRSSREAMMQNAQMAQMNAQGQNG